MENKFDDIESERIDTEIIEEVEVNEFTEVETDDFWLDYDEEKPKKKLITPFGAIIIIGLLLVLVNMLTPYKEYIIDYLTPARVPVSVGEYTHDFSGMTLDIPETYIGVMETDEMVSFTSEDGLVQVTMYFEIGGYDFYSLEKIATNFVTNLTESAMFDEVELLIGADYGDYNDAYRIVVGATVGDITYLYDLVIVNPYSGIRYYIYAVAEEDDYRDYEDEIEDIFDSFALTKTETEIYKLLED